MKKIYRDKKWWGVGLTVGLYVVLAGWRLFELPGEWFGDISILHEEVLDILANPWDWKYNLSAGPLYHHVVVPLAYLFGARYETYKVASVGMGLTGLLAMGWAARAAFGRRVSLFSMALGAGSFWLLVWARLGSSPHIVAVPLVGLVLGCVFLYLKKLDWRWLVAGQGVAVLAWMAYPGIYTLPLVPVVGWVRGGVGGWRKKRRSWVVGGVGLALVTLVGMGGFWYQIQSQPELFSSGYVGEKLFSQELSWGETLVSVGEKWLSNALALWGRGDQVFRINVPGDSHLDRVSGVLVVVGLVAGLWMKKWRRQAVLLVLAWAVLLLPSSAPSVLAGEVPSIGRTIGVWVPVMMLGGLGVEYIGHRLQGIGKELAMAIMVILWLGVVGLNVYKYFWVYEQGLPEGNQAWGRYVAAWIDSLPSDLEVKLTGCCWGEAGQPEPKGIYYVLENQTSRENIVHEYPWIESCGDLEVGKRYAVVFNPGEWELMETFKACLEGEWVEVKDGLGKEVFVGAVGRL
jgi:hypothetical protein